MRIGSLFSGIGLLELGLERAGLGDTAWQAEIDPYCRAVLARHWPEAQRFNSVQEVTREADRVDVLCGGFPCQPFSAAGARRGLADERWLWPEYARIVAEHRPAIVVGENVPGLRGSGLRHVLADLARLGFDAEWCTFRAGDLGAPHERARIWIVATHPDRCRVREQRGSASVGGDQGWFARAVADAAAIAANDGQARDAPDAAGARLEGPDDARGRIPVARESIGGEAPDGEAADADGLRELQPEGRFAQFRGWARDSGWRDAPPAVRGMDDGGASGLDLRCSAAGGCRGETCDHQEAPDSWRVAALGNAVVLQCAELVGRAIVANVIPA